MSPEALVLLVGVIWVAVLVGLLRLLAAMDHVERLVTTIETRTQLDRKPSHG